MNAALFLNAFIYAVGRKEMFYLTTYLAHFIYSYMEKKPAAVTRATLFD